MGAERRVLAGSMENVSFTFAWHFPNHVCHHHVADDERVVSVARLADDGTANGDETNEDEPNGDEPNGDGGDPVVETDD